MTLKKMLWGLLIVVVLGLLGWGMILLRPATPAPTTDNQTPAGADKEYTEDKAYYTIRATYPDNPTVEAAILADISQFKEDSNLENLTAEDIQIQGLGGDRKYSLDISYKKYESEGLTSYVFSIYQDTLGAHPNGFYQTFVFDASGTPLQLAGLFKAGSNYLNVLSAEAYKQVVAELTVRGGAAPDEDQLDTVRIGTAPSPEALQFFYVSNGQLHLLFPPYQVAAYAAGSFDIIVSKSAIQSILK